jgi:hypothetical protein
MRQGGDTGTLLFADRRLILFVLLLVLLLGGIQGPKFVVPLRSLQKLTPQNSGSSSLGFGLG